MEPARAFSGACAAFVAIGVQGAPGRADTPGLELRWSAPAECPSQREVAQSVEQLLAGASAVPLRADARIEKRTDGFVLALSWSTREVSATRVIEGDSCHELAQAAALMLALAAEPKEAPSLASTAPAPTPDAAPSARPSPETPAPPARPNSAVHGNEPRSGWSARAGAAVDAGSLPRATVGVLGGVGVAFGAPHVRLDVLAFAPKEEEKDFGGGRFGLGVASLSPCYRFSFGRVRLTPCAAAELHAVPSRGLRLASREDGVAWLVRIGVGAELALPLTQDLGVFLGVGGMWAPARPRFVVDGEPVFRPSALGVRGSLGFEYEF